MTSPLPSPTFKTSGRTNEAIRSLRLRLQAKLNRELIYDDVIWACVQVAEANEQAAADTLATA